MKKSVLSAAVIAVSLAFGAPAVADMKGMNMNAASESQQPIEARGQVEKISPEKNKVVLSHEPIPALGWPAMKMGFTTAKGVNLENLQPGDSVRFVLESIAGKNEIVQIEKTQ